MIPQSVIVMMMKYPELGKVKTRLALDTSPQFATDAYAAFLKDTVSCVSDSCLTYKCCYSPTSKLEGFKNLLKLTSSKFFSQSEGDLGARLINASDTCFKQNFDSVILIGTDTPQLPTSYLLEANKALTQSDVVIGPAEDGGYYLIGFTKKGYSSSLFTNITWSSGIVFQQTLDQVKHLNLTYTLLPTLCDIDRLKDLKNLPKHSHCLPANTAQLLTQNTFL